MYRFNGFVLLAITLLTIQLSNPVHAEPDNLSLLRQEVVQYHDNGLYVQEFIKVIHEAQRYILTERHNYQPNQKLAVVLDIDETALSNYDEMVKRGFFGTSKQIHREIAAANTPSLLPTLELFQMLRQHHIKVFFITGRRENERQATQRNLHLAGYDDWAALLMRPNEDQQPSVIPFKTEARAEISQKGYIILASIGDQNSDLAGGYALKGFKLPNPYYYLP
jgi:predicted secreted acid phosphatase